MYISPLAAIVVTILAAFWGMPLWMVVLSFFVTGSATALAIALAIFFLSSRMKNHAQEREVESPPRQSAAVDF